MAQTDEAPGLEAEDAAKLKERRERRVERDRRPDTYVQPCGVEIFREAMEDANEEDQKTICDLAWRFSQKKGWRWGESDEPAPRKRASKQQRRVDDDLPF